MSCVLSCLLYLGSCTIQNTNTSGDDQFSVIDTASIDKIFIADKGDNDVLLERKKDHWMVNDKYECSNYSIDILLETIKRIRPKYPVPNAAHNNVIRHMAGKGRKVEIYQKGKEEPVKTYYIGSVTPKQDANYFLLDGAEQPYAVGIPGFKGYVLGRYIVDEKDWRDRTIFSYRPDQVKSITLTYPQTPEHSWHMAVADQQHYALFNMSQQTEQLPISLEQSKALNYVQGFRMLAAEGIMHDYTRKDSLLSSPKLIEITVEDVDGVKTDLDVYNMPVNRRSKKQFNEDGSRVKYDVDRYYAVMNEGKDFVMIQHYVFGKVIRSFEQMMEMRKEKS